MQTTDVHILLIDDEPTVLDEAKEWLIEDFGYQHLDTAPSAQAAIEKLKQTFDVIVADMRMEAEDSGFGILDYVQQHKLSSVVIILTANETFEVTVQLAVLTGEGCDEACGIRERPQDVSPAESTR